MTSEHGRRRRHVNQTGRNEPDIKFVQLHRWMLDSPAYRTLDVYGRALIVELDLLFDGNNNGAIGLSCRKAGKRINADKDKASRSLRTLHDRGFIFPTNEADFRFTASIATTWRLAWRPYQGQKPGKEFMSWQPDKSGFRKSKKRPRKRRARPPGRDGQGELVLLEKQIEEQIEVPPQGTPRPPTGDAGGSARPPTGDTRPPTGDARAPNHRPTRPPTGDTYSLPRSARAAATPTSRGAARVRVGLKVQPSASTPTDDEIASDMVRECGVDFQLAKEALEVLCQVRRRLRSPAVVAIEQRAKQQHPDGGDPYLRAAVDDCNKRLVDLDEAEAVAAEHAGELVVEEVDGEADIPFFD